MWQKILIGNSAIQIGWLSFLFLVHINYPLTNQLVKYLNFFLRTCICVCAPICSGMYVCVPVSRYVCIYTYMWLYCDCLCGCWDLSLDLQARMADILWTVVSPADTWCCFVFSAALGEVFLLWSWERTETCGCVLRQQSPSSCVEQFY